MKKIVLLCLVMMLFTGCNKEKKETVNENFQNNTSYLPLAKLENKDYSQNYSASLQLAAIENLFDKDANRNAIYPDYVGGMYIDDYDTPVVQIVLKETLNLDAKEKSRYNKIYNSNVKIEYVDYSYNELEKVRVFIVDDFMKGKLDSLVKHIYTDTINNRVVVGLSNYNSENIETFKKEVVDSPVVIFEQGAEFSF